MFSGQGSFLVPLIPSLVCGQLGGLYHSWLPPHKLEPRKVGGLQSYPDSCLRQVGPDCNLLPGAHVWVTVSLESGFQLLELLAGEVRPLPPLLLLERAVFRVGVVRLVLLGLLSVCEKTERWERSPELTRRLGCIWGACPWGNQSMLSEVPLCSSSCTHRSGPVSSLALVSRHPPCTETNGPLMQHGLPSFNCCNGCQLPSDWIWIFQTSNLQFSLVAVKMGDSGRTYPGR